MGSLGASSKHLISESDIKNIKSLLASSSTTILTPSDKNYENSLKRWSRAAEKPAGLVIVPTTAEEISIALKYATEHGIDVAVKGGGHSTAGVSSTNGGLLFDMGKMRRVDVDVEKKHLKIQGGAVWGDVDQAGAKHNLATVGGTVEDTGVGGLTLGGGYGWLSGQHGLTIDNWVESTIVLANGEIVKTSEKENPDLFWALRGAGQNFGIVTEFVLQAHDQGEIWAGMLIYEPTSENIEKLVKASNAMYNPDASGNTKLRGKVAGGLGIARPPPAGGKIMLLVPVIFFGTEEEGKKEFAEFFEIGPVISTVKMVPYPTANTLLVPPPGLRASMKGAAFTMPLRKEFVQNVMDEYVKFTHDQEDLGISLVLWELYDPKQVVSRDNGSFANRGLHLNGMICPIWTKAENDASCRQWARDLNEVFKKELEFNNQNTGDGVDGGVGVRGDKGAVLLYGNYDRKFSPLSFLNLVLIIYRI